MPWTNAEYEQIRGRIFRQGQNSSQVTVIIPITFAQVGSQYWSWCESKWSRVLYKKSLSDAAVEGIVPKGHLRSPEHAFKDTINWLHRIDDEGILNFARPIIEIPLIQKKKEANPGKSTT